MSGVWRQGGMIAIAILGMSLLGMRSPQGGTFPVAVPFVHPDPNATLSQIGVIDSVTQSTTSSVAEIGTLPNVAQGAGKKPAAPVLRRLQSVPSDLGLDEQLWSSANHSGDRPALVRAIDYSLRYLRTAQATTAYRNYPVKGVTRDRVERSLRRFRSLVMQAKTPKALQQAIQAEFDLYESIGKDQEGTVAFTGYFEPVHTASPVRTAEFRYPLYRRPAQFERWQKPHPTREQLEGKDGLQGDRGLLKGLELVWIRDRLEAFLIQVQGSSQLQLTNGKRMTIGYDGHTDHPYTGIGRELVKDGKLKVEDLNLPNVTRYFQENPAALDEYLPRNHRFVFFRNTQGAPAIGSLGQPVTPERSIATDKKLMPPGALAMIATPLPDRQLHIQPVHRYVLDQDTGGAIIGPGRVDVFMGTGKLARDRAGLIRAEGRLYYLLLKESIR
ncbi:MAG: MltA domain-containing protein [Synechococcales bacterium]|nr:MltA domain-containing protein [Synechococcales bacterium]